MLAEGRIGGSALATRKAGVEGVRGAFTEPATWKCMAGLSSKPGANVSGGRRRFLEVGHFRLKECKTSQDGALPAAEPYF